MENSIPRINENIYFDGIDQAIKNSQTINQIFANAGKRMPKKMVVSEQQLDEIESELESDLSKEELEYLWHNCRNIRSVLSGFRSRVDDFMGDIINKVEES